MPPFAPFFHEQDPERSKKIIDIRPYMKGLLFRIILNYLYL